MFILSRKKLVPLLLFLCTVVTISALTSAFFPVRRTLIFIFSAFSIIMLKAASGWINNKALMASLVLLTLVGIPASYWPEPHYYALTIYFILGVLAVSTLEKNEIDSFVRILSPLCLIVLIGGVIGTLYAYFDGKPLLAFANEDGRLNQLYLTTLTNAQLENLIRPSGIFDEPGTLSFIVCVTAALRHGLGYGKKMTWTILLLGFITFSVAHLIFVGLYALENLKSYRFSFRPVFLVGVLGVFIFLLFYLIPALPDLFSLLFLNRFKRGDLGDDRSNALRNGLKYLNETTVLYGLDPECATGVKSCVEKGYKYYGETPVSMLLSWGIFASFPYYLGMLYSLIFSIRYLDFVMLGIFALLLQRPFTMNVGYSLLIILTIYVLAKKRAWSEPNTPLPAT